MNTRNISASGAVVAWSAGCEFDRDRIRRNLALIDLESHTPNVRTNESSLEQALVSTLKAFKSEHVVKALKKRADGFDVSELVRGDTQVEYRSIFKASVNDQNDVTTIRNGSSMIDTWTFQREVQQAYDSNKRQTTGVAVGNTLTSILGVLGGLRLREAGGIYYLPEDQLDKWRAVEGAITDAALDKLKIRFDLIRVVADERGLKAIRASLEDEVSRVANELLTEITTGTLKEKALENRRAAAVALAEKVEAYEEIIGETLTNLRNACDLAREAAVMSAMQLMAS